MVLSQQQIRELIESPKGAAALKEARDHEDRVKLHAKAVDSRMRVSDAYPRFIDWVGNGIRLHADKFNVFKSMCTFPLSTNSLVDSVFKEYRRIFSANDAVTEITMTEASLRDEFQEYLKEINIRDYFQHEGFKIYKQQPCSVYVVDLPAMQVTPRPQPYFYPVAISAIKDMGVSKAGIEYLIIQVEKDLFVAIDAEKFVTIRKTDKDEFITVAEGFHGLGYCPATFMIHSALNSEEDKSPVTRMSPLSLHLGDLDWLLFFKTAQRMYETYGPFPITVIPDEPCSYADAETGHQCTSGWVTGIDDTGQKTKYKCPACSKKTLAGPGSVYYQQIPRTKDDPEIKNPVSIIPPDVPSLEFVAKKVDYLEWELYENLVGSNEDHASKEAINVQQVQSQAENKRNILLQVKRDFELTEQFIINTMGRLMYGEFYQGCNVNYGEDFLLYNELEIVGQYVETKKAGLPNYMVAQKRDMLIGVASKNNTYQQQRLKVLQLLEPWTELSLAECVAVGFKDLYPEKFLLKSDFAKFVSKFEMENGDVVEWGSLLSFPVKIDRINQILNEYVSTEVSQAREPEQPAVAQ